MSLFPSNFKPTKLNHYLLFNIKPFLFTTTTLRHLTEHAPPIRDTILLAHNIVQQNGIITFSFEQELTIVNKDWSTNLATDCYFVAVVTGDFYFSQLFPHTYIPKFSSTCFNLTKLDLHNLPPPQAFSVDTLEVKMTVNAQFSDQLRDRNSSEFQRFQSSLELYVSRSN